MKAVLLVLAFLTLAAIGRTQLSDYCVPAKAEKLKITYDNVTCTLDPKYPFNGSCRNWQIISAIAFVNTANPQDQLAQIQEYLDKAGANCSADTHIEFVTPVWTDCYDHSVNWTSQNTIFDQLIEGFSLVQADPRTAVTAIGDLLNNTVLCANGIPLDNTKHTGIVYLFTDFNCTQLIDSQVTVVMSNLRQLLKHGFSVQMVTFGIVDSSCRAALECLNCTNPRCQMVSMNDTPLANCRNSPLESQYCSDAEITILNNTVTCTLEPLQTYNPSCRSWNIMAAITFLNISNVENQLIQVATYLNETGAACDASSQLQIVTPQWTSCEHTVWWNYSTNLMNSLIKSPGYAIPDPRNKTTTVADVMTEALLCANILSSRAGIVYLFTDFNCSEMLQSEVVRLMRMVKQFLLKGYSVSMVLFNVYNVASDCSDVLNCLNCTQPYCQISTIDGQSFPPATCRYDDTPTGLTYPFGDPATTKLMTTTLIPQSYGTPPPPAATTATTSTTPKPTDASSNITTLELALVIGIPCISLVMCCIICAVCCSKTLRHRAMAKVGLNKKVKGRFPFSEEGGKIPSSPNLDNFAAANHYMDIKQLAARNKNDYWELPPKNLVIHDGEILGTGAFSNVFKGTLTGKVPLVKAQTGISLNIENQKDGSCETAVKRLPAHADEQNRMDFFHEIDFMKRLGYHVHIIAMLGCISDPWDPLILVEYCHHGDMLKFLRNRRSYLLVGQEDECPLDADMCLRIKDLVSFAWQISDGLSYLSSKNFIHRDVAARNVLLTKNLVAKVSDFGLCRYIDSALYTAKGGKLPIKWMAIESLKFYEYSVKTDVWAYGVCLFEIFSMGDGPYQAIQPLEVLKHLEKGNRLERPEKCPTEIYDLMIRCWDANADMRPTFNEIRGQLTTMLNLDDEHYGYLSVNHENLPQYLMLPEILPMVPEVDEFALPTKLPTIQILASTPPRPKKLKNENEVEKEEIRKKKDKKKHLKLLEKSQRKKRKDDNDDDITERL